ncbi:hypothetical protein GRF29_154g1360690 [Pseudopithomyces chartarum]|uniref:Phosphoribulokinase/uridine kinase domain-containing protein n=1 Tax=Pseudopithomyces chartarum TaxID=1892770 RepID=A0AAN6LR93_9PLEO|nr:hypothetical protein GRF29_154g1360690 [Pseudopithomyces chartarum]
MGHYHVHGASDQSPEGPLELRNHMSRAQYSHQTQDSFYKPLTPEQSKRAFANDYDFDSPEAIDFDVLVDKLRDIKAGHQSRRSPQILLRETRPPPRDNNHVLPHVVIVEGIFALHDPRVLSLLDLKIFAEADADLCLSRRLTRDVKERGRDIEGCIKQWFGYVKPNFYNRDQHGEHADTEYVGGEERGAPGGVDAVGEDSGGGAAFGECIGDCADAAGEGDTYFVDGSEDDEGGLYFLLRPHGVVDGGDGGGFPAVCAGGGADAAGAFVPGIAQGEGGVCYDCSAGRIDVRDGAPEDDP